MDDGILKVLDLATFVMIEADTSVFVVDAVPNSMPLAIPFTVCYYDRIYRVSHRSICDLLGLVALDL